MGAMNLFGKEIKEIMWIAVPQMLQMYILMVVGRITLALVGHFDPAPAHIAGAALGSMYSNVTGISIGVGVSIALGSFCAQNFGRGAADENGIVFWQCIKALIGAFMFSLVAALFADRILGSLGQPFEVLEPCRFFSIIQALSLPAQCFGCAVNGALLSQKLQVPGFVTSILGSMVNLFMSWWLLAVHNIGFLAIAYANVVGSCFSTLLLVLYVVRWGRQDVVWRMPHESSGATKISLVCYLREAIPSAMSLWAEWWAAEILALFAGLLPGGEISVAANGILFNTLAIFYMTFVGVQIATQQRMGELVGARDVLRAPKCIMASVFSSVALAMVCMSALEIYGTPILHLYTSNLDIVSEAESANLGMVISIAPYAVMMSLLGGLRSAGLQRWGTCALCISFYIFGIPAGYYLGLVQNWGLLGIWMGNVTSLALSALSMSVKVCTVDWRKVLDEAMSYQDSDCKAQPLLAKHVSGELVPSNPILLGKELPDNETVKL